MDINEPITNKLLVDIMKKVKQNKVTMEIFWKEIFKAKFLCPIDMELGSTSQKEKQKIVLGEETNISLLSIDNGKGEHFLMAFTDWDELKKWKQNQKTLILLYDDYQEIILRKESMYQGIVINPFGENIVLDRKILASTRENMETVQKGESVMLGKPKEYPTDLVNELKKYFVIMKSVDKAYLLWMVRGNESSYLLVIDSKMSTQQLFPSIGQICQPFLRGKLLDIILADSSLGKAAIEEQTPFFIK